MANTSFDFRADAPPPSLFSATTVLSLLSVAVIGQSAYTVSLYALPKGTSKTIRGLFLWHMFDFMLHSTLEASWLYHVFFSWQPVPAPEDVHKVDYYPFSFTAPDTAFLNRPDRLYGTYYGNSPMAALWREYAKADRRAGGTDLTTVCMELLCVFVMAPVALYVCHLLRKGKHAQAWFWASFVATSELYGNFMTFAPEWITGCPNLNTSHWMYYWGYLMFFNAGLWVTIPCWVLYQAYYAIGEAFEIASESKARKDR